MNQATFNAIQQSLKGQESTWQWSFETQAYSAASGDATVSARVLTDEAVKRSGKAMAKLNEQLREGAITKQAWLEGAESEIMSLNLQTGSIARGGLLNMKAADFASIENRTASQLADLQAVYQRLDDAEYVKSASFDNLNWFAKAGRATYEAERLDSHADAGFGYEQYSTHAVKSCQDCLDRESAGVQPIGTSPGVGEVSCGNADDCTVQYFRDNPEAS
jgi:hypothetical protein